MSIETLIWLAIMLGTFGVVWFAAPYHTRAIDAARERSQHNQNRPLAEALMEQGPSNPGCESGNSDDARNLCGPQHHVPDHGRESRVLH